MRLLFFTNTPAHVHLFRNAIAELSKSGHEVSVLARDYGCTTALLDWHDIPFTCYGACDTSKSSLFRQLPAHYARIARATLAFDPDLIFGVGGYAAPAGALSRTPTILFHDSEPTTLDHYLSQPFARAIVTPSAFRKRLGENHFTFPGVLESAYLHPDRFTKQTTVRERLNVGEDEAYVVVRLNAFGSHHDVGHEGFTPAQRRDLIEHLDQFATVFVSDEGEDLSLEALPARDFDPHPALLHDALSEAALLVADTQTVVTEAALLGTPSIRSNSFVGDDDMGNFIELADRGLVRNVSEYETVRRESSELLQTDGIQRQWQQRRDEFLAESADLTSIITTLGTNGGDVTAIDELQKGTVAAAETP